MSEYRIGYLTVMLPGLCLLAVMLGACGARSEADEAEPQPVSYENPNTGFEDFGIKDENGDLLPERNLPEPDPADGRLAQPLIFAPAGATNPGVKPSTFTSCFQGDTTQNCVVPRLKDIVFWFASGSAAKQSVYAGLIFEVRDRLIAQGLEQCNTNGCWHFRQATSEFDPELTVRIVLNESPEISACAGSSGKLRQYVCVDGQTTGLQKIGTELSGNFHRFTGAATIAFDEGEVQFAPLLPSQRTNRRRQMVGSAVLWMMGQGSVVVGGSRCINEDVIPAGTTCTYAASEACRANAFGGEENQSQIQVLGADCGT